MYSQRQAPPQLKRSYSGDSQSSYASRATTASNASSKLLFGEIPLSPTTTVDGRCKTPWSPALCGKTINKTQRCDRMAQYATSYCRPARSFSVSGSTTNVATTCLDRWSPRTLLISASFAMICQHALRPTFSIPSLPPSNHQPLRSRRALKRFPG